MTELNFHWKAEWITPRLTMAVGSVILKWAMVDADFTSMARSFWFKDHPEERMPQSFTRRSKNFIQSVGKLYHLEPEEFRQFCWFVHRMRIAASKRDDLAHSKPGLVKRNGREYEGLWIEHPSAATRTIEMSVIDIEMLAEEISSLHVESGQVGMALHVAAQVAALREKYQIRQLSVGCCRQ